MEPENLSDQMGFYGSVNSDHTIDVLMDSCQSWAIVKTIITVIIKVMYTSRILLSYLVDT